MTLADVIDQVENFDSLDGRQKIQIVAWYLHAHKAMEAFAAADIRACFSGLHLQAPDVAKYLARMEGYGDLMKERGKYKLARSVRTQLDGQLGTQHTVVQVDKLLTELPGKVSNRAEQNFLVEAIKCYRIEAYRSCVVMMWNLAYSHLLEWLLADASRLDKFNAAIVRRYAKRGGVSISKYDDFLEEFKEAEVLEICNTAGVLSSNILKVLKEKLSKRNIAAHPSSNVIVRAQADDVVTDLVNNVLLHLT